MKLFIVPWYLDELSHTLAFNTVHRLFYNLEQIELDKLKLHLKKLSLCMHFIFCAWAFMY